MAGAQDLRSLYCFLSSLSAPGHPLLRQEQRPGMPLRPQSLEKPWRSPSLSGHLLRLTSHRRAHPPLSYHFWGREYNRILAAETLRWPDGSATQLRVLLHQGPNKSRALNYSSRLILMRFLGDRRGVREAIISGGLFFNPKEVCLEGSG